MEINLDDELVKEMNDPEFHLTTLRGEQERANYIKSICTKWIENKDQIEEKKEEFIKDMGGVMRTISVFEMIVAMFKMNAIMAPKGSILDTPDYRYFLKQIEELKELYEYFREVEPTLPDFPEVPVSPDLDDNVRLIHGNVI